MEAWEQHLYRHPDRTFVAYLLQGLREGFRIGFDRTTPCRATTRNLKSVYDHPEVVDAYLEQEVALGRVICLSEYKSSSLPDLTTSPIGVIPKRRCPNKWRLIVDLSLPKGASVNDGISSSLCSLSYASVDDAVKMLLTLGKGALMAKLDLKEAYHMVPVHPQHRPLLGMQWKGY